MEACTEAAKLEQATQFVGYMGVASQIILKN